MLARTFLTRLSSIPSTCLTRGTIASPLVVSTSLHRSFHLSSRLDYYSPPLPQTPRTPSATSRINSRRLPTDRELPRLKSRTPLYLTLALLSATTWGLFLFYATNAERSNSSVIRSLAFQLRTSQVVKDFLGDRVELMNFIGDFKRVKGNINMLAGRIDVQFKVKGDKASGTAIFTSVRRGKEGRFEVLRWKIIRDGDGQVLDLKLADPRMARKVIDRALDENAVEEDRVV